MMRLYEHYNSQCEAETEGGGKQKGPWRRIPSYNRSLKYATGTNVCSALVFQAFWLFMTKNQFLLRVFFRRSVS